MKLTIKTLYLVSLLEFIVLGIFLLWKPSESSNQFFLGRSVYKWAFAFLPIFLSVSGVIFFLLYLRRNKTISRIVTKALDFFYLLENKAGILLIADVLFLLFIFFGYFLSRQYNFLSLFVRTLPFLFIYGVMVFQINYVVFIYARETGEKLSFKNSILQAMSLVNDLLFKEQISSSAGKNDLNKVYWGVVLVLICTFIFVSYFFLKFAALNSDEGWYLYASRQVFLGQRPYQDFAFTQMPFLPYLYGLSLLIYPSIYAGRLTSLILFGISIYVLFLLAKRHSSSEAFIWIFMILLTYSDAFYFNTIVKTYSLTLLFFLLTICLLGSNIQEEIKYPLIFLILQLGLFTRLTFVFFAIFIVFSVLRDMRSLTSKYKIWRSILMVNVPLFIVGLYFLYPDPQKTIWNIYIYHARIRGFSFSVDFLIEYISHLRGYIYSIKTFWPLGVPLVISIIPSVYCKSAGKKKISLLFIATLSAFMFLSVHFVSADPMHEYYVPATLLLLSMLVLFLSSFSTVSSGITFLILWGTRFSITAIIIMLVYTGRFGKYNYDYYHGRPPIETVREISEVVNSYYPQQRIVTLEALYVAVEAGREVPHGLSMSQFSIIDLPPAEAEYLHLITHDYFIDLLKSSDTKVVVLSERELKYFDNSWMDGYVNVFEVADFGQKSVQAYVFVRRGYEIP
jgi:hypothetical protein